MRTAQSAHLRAPRLGVLAAAWTVGVALSACGGGAGRGSVMPTSIDVSEPLTVLDASDPLELWLGRGSGMNGLDTVYVGPHAEVELYRHHRADDGAWWERAHMQLTPSDMVELRASITSHHLLALDHAYQNGTADGTQWIIAIVQGERGHVSLFGNVFPDGVESFAYDVDQLLAQRGLAAVQWTRVPHDEEGTHDDALWDAAR